MVKVSIRYDGALRCTAQHEPSGSKLSTDAPVDNHGKGELFSPTDLVGTALGSCMATVMGIVADHHAVDLSGMKIEITKEMSDNAPRRIARLAADVHIPLASDHSQRASLERAALTCPVLRSLNPSIETPVEFHWRHE